MGEMRIAYRVSVGGKLMERDHLEEPGVDGRIILRWSKDVGCGGWNGLICLRKERGRGAIANAVMNLRVP
jgi:hypothetical protein